MDELRLFGLSQGANAVSVTIKQIAQRAQLSVPTVSRILNNDSELFRPETREKVWSAAHELGYRPNSYRMALRTKRFGAIGLLVGQRQIEGSISAAVLRSLLVEMHARSQHLLVGEVPPHTPGNGELAVAGAPKMIREWAVDGLLMDCEKNAPGGVDKLIRDYKIAAIWLNSRDDDDCVYPDDRQGAREATERLIRSGHRAIAFVSLDGRTQLDPALAERLEGFESAVYGGAATAHRLIPNDRVPPADQLDLLLEFLRTHSDGNRPTAALCCGRRAATAMFAAALASGLSVPKDFSIIAIHDEPVDDPGRRITTMCLPSSEMALQGLAALIDKISEPTRPMPSRAIPLTYCDGATLSPPGGV